MFCGTPDRFRLPGFGNTQAPAAEYAPFTVIEKLAPAGLISLAMLVANLTSLPGTISEGKGRRRLHSGSRRENSQ